MLAMVGVIHPRLSQSGRGVCGMLVKYYGKWDLVEARGMTMGGWIKLYRKFLDSPVWKNPNLARFWTWCLLKATHDGYTTTIGYSRVELKPGQFIFTRPLCSIETSLSDKVVRLCLDSLRNGEDPEIGLTKGHNFSVITLLKWRDYQNNEGEQGRQKSGKGPTKGRLINNEGKNGKKQRGESDVVEVTWNGEKLTVPEVIMQKFREKYPTIDIPGEIIAAELWLLKHPKNAAEYKRFDLFLMNWFGNAKPTIPATSPDYYEVSEADAAEQMEIERRIAKEQANQGPPKTPLEIIKERMRKEAVNA